MKESKFIVLIILPLSVLQEFRLYALIRMFAYMYMSDLHAMK